MPPQGVGGGRPSCLDGLAPCDGGAKGRGRTGARTGEGVGKGLETAQITKIHFKPPPGVGGGSVAGEGVGIGILAERNDIKAPSGSGRGQAELSGRSRPMRRRSKGARTDRREDGGRGGEWVASVRHGRRIKACATRPRSAAQQARGQRGERQARSGAIRIFMII